MSYIRNILATGVFDVLHPGHIDLLRLAWCQGLGGLIVGINADSTVRRLKGPHRPIFNQYERKLMLESIRWVDRVVIFDEDTPAELIRRANPEVWVKGDDYTLETISAEERAACESVGARIVFLPRLAGLSTTNIVNRLCNSAK